MTFHNWYTRLVFGLMFASMIVYSACSKKTTTTTTTTSVKEKHDSVVRTKEITKDSSFYSKIMEEKTLPGAAVGITLNDRNALDSLITALGNLPSSVPRVVTYQDKQSKVLLSIALDSLNRIKLNCIANDLKYLETTITQTRTFERYRDSLATERTEKELLREELKVVKKRSSFSLIIFIIGSVLLSALVLYVRNKFF